MRGWLLVSFCMETVFVLAQNGADSVDVGLKQMKRESGGNPGQSRCCELIVRFVSNLKPLPYL